MPRPVLDPVTFRRLCRARDLAAARLDDPPGLAEMAAAANLSPWHFHRLFADAFGATPHGFVAERRLAAAKHLLLSGEASVTEACVALGYSSLGTFSARFRAATGLSPTAFRREHRRVYGVKALYRTVFIPSCFLAAYGA
ncbi:helix-turn-helix domain-containing protein [Caulobacter sp. KR2-114]|uniref:helix-turn-helix domain-containing protein n=1 Tax=Caulobacter sp. KR2-114 TaxID=3400912 RepID=UPI003C017150